MDYIFWVGRDYIKEVGGKGRKRQ